MHKKKLLLGVCGAIGAINVPQYLHALNHQYEIDVILTQNAQRFITVQAIKPFVNNVFTDVLDESVIKTPHVNLAKEADVFLILPTTANFLFKLANGVADDLLSLCAVNYEDPIFLAPNMNTRMWNNHGVQNNITKLQSYGYIFLNRTSNGVEASSGNVVNSEAALPDPHILMNLLSRNSEKVGAY
ncbi:flavoprotein [Lysinibacillus sp. JNUCC 51]|uniref:flavoprotein n=1 Tax=Lysinibacillus sp. JNUCC-51 TaxID=2792479 RepID=UPI00193908EC|nr:hypothetical protein JNUCC51_18175 [Lysinibacillus sp. JNUCC-51]